MPLSAEEFNYVLNAPNRDTATGARDYAVMLLLARCDLRPRQIARLLTADFAGNVLRVGSKSVTLPEGVRAALRRYLQLDASRRRIARRDHFLFQPTVNNRTCVYDKPLSERMIRYMVKRYAEFAGVKCRVSPKSLRPQDVATTA